MLKKIVLAPNFDMDHLATITEGYSNSDLKELCRNAVMVPVRESIRTASAESSGQVSRVDPKSLRIRAVEMRDFEGFVDNLYSRLSMNSLVPDPVD